MGTMNRGLQHEQASKPANAAKPPVYLRPIAWVARTFFDSQLCTFIVDGKRFQMFIRNGTSLDDAVDRVANKYGGEVSRKFYESMNASQITKMRIGDASIDDSIHFFVGEKDIPLLSNDGQLIFPNSAEIKIGDGLNTFTFSKVDFNANPLTLSDMDSMYGEQGGLRLSSGAREILGRNRQNDPLKPADTPRDIAKSIGGAHADDRNTAIVVDSSLLLKLNYQTGELVSVSESTKEIAMAQSEQGWEYRPHTLLTEVTMNRADGTSWAQVTVLSSRNSTDLEEKIRRESQVRGCTPEVFVSLIAKERVERIGRSESFVRVDGYSSSSATRQISDERVVPFLSPFAGRTLPRVRFNEIAGSTEPQVSAINDGKRTSALERKLMDKETSARSKKGDVIVIPIRPNSKEPARANARDSIERVEILAPMKSDSIPNTSEDAKPVIQRPRPRRTARTRTTAGLKGEIAPRRGKDGAARRMAPLKRAIERARRWQARRKEEPKARERETGKKTNSRDPNSLERTVSINPRKSGNLKKPKITSSVPITGPKVRQTRKAEGKVRETTRPIEAPGIKRRKRSEERPARIDLGKRKKGKKLPESVLHRLLGFYASREKAKRKRKMGLLSAAA